MIIIDNNTDSVNDDNDNDNDNIFCQLLRYF